jgi:hypothetical protein
MEGEFMERVISEPTKQDIDNWLGGEEMNEEKKRESSAPTLRLSEKSVAANHLAFIKKIVVGVLDLVGEDIFLHGYKHGKEDAEVGK